MAHSIQSFRGKSKIVKDLDLIVFILFALKIVSRSSDFESIRSLSEEWQAQLNLYGPGVIDLKFGQLLRTPVEERDFAILLEAILNEAGQYQETIPASFLNSFVNKQAPSLAVTFYDYNVSFLKDTVKAIEILVSKA